MRFESFSKRILALIVSLGAVMLYGVTVTAQEPRAEASYFDQVGEMERPPGIVVATRRERAALAEHKDVGRALALLEQRVDQLWKDIRALDVPALSRYQLEATEGYSLPAKFEDWEGRVLGENDGLLYLELRGPRLPAKYDIVFRYLYIFASFDPLTNEIGRPVVTIRGWIEE